MRDYFSIIIVVIWVSAEAQYFHPTPAIKFPILSIEYLPPTTATVKTPTVTPPPAAVEQFSTPSNEYLPPTTTAPPPPAAVEQFSTLSIEYLPPTTTTSPPSKTVEQFSTPSNEYLPPTTITTTTTSYSTPSITEPEASTFTLEVSSPKTTTTLKSTTTTEHHHHHKEEMLFWDFRESIPGEPEQDYPILNKIPSTKFACNGRLNGYYADLDTRCQVFHVCSTLPDGQYIQSSFLCPNGTIFRQETFSCQWWADVDCALSGSFYELNAKIGMIPESMA